MVVLAAFLPIFIFSQFGSLVNILTGNSSTDTPRLYSLIRSAEKIAGGMANVRIAGIQTVVIIACTRLRILDMSARTVLMT